MGIFKWVSKSLVIIVFLFAIVIVADAKEINIDNFYGLTVREAVEYSKDGNPIDVFLDYKEQNGGEIDGSYGDYVGTNGDYIYEIEDRVIENNKKIKNTIEKGEKEVKNVEANNKKGIIKQELNKNIVKIVIFIILLVFLVITLIYIKKVVLIIIVVLLLALDIVLINPLKLIDIYNNVSSEKYIEYEITNADIEKREEENKTKKEGKIENDNRIDDSVRRELADEEYIMNMCNKKYDVAYVINDYILKMYYMVREKSKNRPFNYEEVETFFDFDKEDEKSEKDIYVDKVTMLNKSTFLDRDPNDWGLNMHRLSLEAMEEIYEKITDKDIEDLKNGKYIDKIVRKINTDIQYTDAKYFKNQDMPLSRYLVSKMDFRALCYKMFDEEILRALKDWYIECDMEIELPYEVKLEFNIQKFIKRDIKEWIGTNESELNGYDEDSDLILYYKDSKGEIHGDFIPKELLNDENKYNRVELLYDVKKATIKFLYDNIKEEIKVNPYDENGNYLRWMNTNEEIEFGKSRGTGRDMSLLTDILTRWKFFSDRNFTQNFYNKYTKDINLLDAYDIDRFEPIAIDKHIVKTDKLLQRMFMKNGTDKICLYKVFWVDDAIDDIELYIIPDDKMNLTYEEMYNLAFND